MKIDTKKSDAIKALQAFGFIILREREHIVMQKEGGIKISIPNHKRIKGSTLTKEIRRAGIEPKLFWEKV